jgi:hypothetical protein
MPRWWARVPTVFWYFYVASIIVAVSVNSVYLMSFHKPKVSEGWSRSEGPGDGVVYTEVEELTFISVPRPLKEEKQYKRMKLAIGSWLACSPHARVILFINRTNFDPSGKFPNELESEFGENRVTYAGAIRADFSGVPYINDWFIQGVRHAKSRYVCFINSDILLSGKWLKRVRQVFQAMPDDLKPVLIGQRIDFDMQDSRYKRLTFSQEQLLKDIDSLVDSSKHSDHSPYGVDTFTFRIDPLPFDVEKIPPFVMGRYNWDNWLIGWLNKICDTITFNLDPPIYHMNHPRHNFDVNDSKVAINHHLKKANNDYFGSNYDTKWEIVDGELVSRKRGKRFHLD